MNGDFAFAGGREKHKLIQLAEPVSVISFSKRNVSIEPGKMCTEDSEHDLARKRRRDVPHRITAVRSRPRHLDHEAIAFPEANFSDMQTGRGLVVQYA